MGCSFSTTPPSASSSISFRTISTATSTSNLSNSLSLGSKLIDLDSGSSDILDLEQMRALLAEYMIIEDRIQALESSNPVTVFYVKKSQLDQIDTKIKDQLLEIEGLKNVLRLKRDLRVRSTSRSRVNSSSSMPSMARKRQPSVLTVLENMGDKKFSKEEQEVLTTTNKLEIATTELEMLYQEKALHGQEVTALYEILSQLSDEYKNENYILAQLGIDDNFNEDSKEESELVDLESRRVTISENYERWKLGRAALIQICGQFSMVLTNMDEAAVHPSIDEPVVSFNGRGIYEIGEEIRDRLVSIQQGLNNVIFLLRIELPYCAGVEMSLLQKAMTYLFIDLRTDERRQHAKDCYAAFQRRTIALLTWVDTTIGTVIQPALEQKTVQIQEKVLTLSQTRLEKICKQFPDLYGKRRHKISSPLIDTSANNKLEWESTLTTVLDPTSIDLLTQLDVKLLAKLPDPLQLFDSDCKKIEAPLKDPPPAIQGRPIINAKDRTNRFTRKASMDNLTQMLVGIN